MAGASLYELVRVGRAGLLAEVVQLRGDRGIIQVYEDTTGLRTGDPVEPSGSSLTVELGPGLLGSVLDGIGRPLHALAEATGPFIGVGQRVPTLDRSCRWRFRATRSAGVVVGPGDIVGVVERADVLEHRVLVPPLVRGTIAEIGDAEVTIDEPIGRLEDGTELRLSHHWPVRRPRPAGRRLPGTRPLVTGQRILDLLFPVAEGGSVAVPGGFGTGKTIIEQSLAKHADADVVVYIACGERGNEVAEVLASFPELSDPRTGCALMGRTVLIANTSNMPVAARESSIYLGLTIAEYYRDMGYRVAVMADSVSRWAEALRELASRMQELPGEEGYPTYLGNRIGQAFERSGRVRALGGPERDGSVTFIAAISPPGGDLSEPVTQAALRVVGALWALNAELAHQRHFPAIDWTTSYSLFGDQLAPWFAEHAGAGWTDVRREVQRLLQEEQDLREIAALIGVDSLQDPERLTMEVARLLRETVLAQSAFDPNDARSAPEKTLRLASLALDVRRVAARALAAGRRFEQIDLEKAQHAIVHYRDAAPDEMEERGAAAEAAIAGLMEGGS